jgi:phosphatidylglycerol---prolipoprotein diacylglyceryl transferase
MLPYFPQPKLALGPFTIHAFGVLVAAAVLVGTWMVKRRLERDGLPLGPGQQLLSYVLIGGFLGAHLVDRLVYYPAETLADPITLLKVWEGLSSFGGFLGAVLGAIIFLRRQPPEAGGLPYLDAVAYGFPFGWIFGRLGCFVAYDHPGSETRFFLSQYDSAGVLRHNLGLDEALYTIVIAAVFAVLGRRKRVPGFYLGLLPVVYAPFRFAVDFLRKNDVRYGGLTPGQWGCFALVALGIVILRLAYLRAAATPATTTGTPK